MDRSFYDSILANDFKDEVLDWAYQTRELSSQMILDSDVMKIQFSDKARIFFTSMNVFGVSPNFAKVLPKYSLPIVKTFAESPYDPYEFLYTPRGYMTCAIS